MAFSMKKGKERWTNTHRHRAEREERNEQSNHLQEQNSWSRKQETQERCWKDRRRLIMSWLNIRIIYFKDEIGKEIKNYGKQLKVYERLK